ncbi:MAG: LysM peptidoglycan-binding domain-containing protein, partial [Planctomycetes bacterium]|nr:LysM peptidoglycan-binding domain-containing protein [Planctomycetota bacterium]
EVNVSSARPGFGPAAFDSGAAIDRAIDDLAATTYGDAMAKARVLMQQDRLADALAMLSKFYDKPELSAAEHRELNSLLDQLAGTVIYSRDYFIEGRPYEVRGGESLQVIAEAHKVPWQLLAKINGIDDPNNLQPGQRLKVIEGPFKAIISLDRRQLHLMVQNRYAGRFPIDVKGIAREDRTRVRTKNHTGDRFLELSNKVRICGPKHVAVTSGCTFVLSQDDVEDLFDILQVSSDVVIRR